ncbi:MAG: hypothetical protein KatS3mg131_2810 [Candidatus Tectimicrobiota bacterium]|nr:MAG: hypothetical protein KatS3mg131_2810 [Candidatus Tectomicrobia bacterium]
MLNLRVDKARVHVEATFRLSGSVLADTVQAEAVGVTTRLELESPEDPARLARLVRLAERGCFVMQALQRPVPVTTATLVNGTPLA